MRIMQAHRPLGVGFAVLALAVVVLTAGCGGAGDPDPAPADTTSASSLTTQVSAQEGPATSLGGTTVAPSTGSTLPAGAGLTLEQVRNARIAVGSGEEALTVALVDGSYQDGRGNDPSRVKVTLMGDPAFGNLDEDGVGDAAIILRVQRGIGGGGADERTTEYVVALLQNGGEAPLAASYEMGPGARVQSVTIGRGGISVEAKVPGLEESPGHAKVPVTALLRLPDEVGAGRSLVLASQTSETPAGDIRRITITSPEPEAMVVGQVEITGTVTIAPFENNLVYHVYDPSMNELAVGPVMVDAPEPGAPGSFSFFVDLMALGCLGSVLVTVSDLSALDGSMLALDSVELLNAAPT